MNDGNYQRVAVIMPYGRSRRYFPDMEPILIIDEFPYFRVRTPEKLLATWFLNAVVPRLEEQVFCEHRRAKCTVLKQSPVRYVVNLQYLQPNGSVRELLQFLLLEKKMYSRWVSVDARDSVFDR